jgi:hypothetical protein
VERAFRALPLLGPWLLEADPRVLDALEKLLAQEMENLELRRAESATVPQFVQDCVDGLVWILQRNGRGSCRS